MKQLEPLEIISKHNNLHNEGSHNLWDEVSRDLISHYGHALYKNWFSKITFYEKTKNNKCIMFVVLVLNFQHNNNCDNYKC